MSELELPVGVEAAADTVVEEAAAVDAGDGQNVDAPPQQSFNLPMMQLTLNEVSIEIVDRPDVPGGKAVVVGPIVFSFVLPFTEEGAQKVASDLSGTSLAIVPATALDQVKQDINVRRRLGLVRRG